MGPIAFSILAGLVVFAALAVILHPDPVYSALSLVVVLCLLAVFFVALGAHMIAALQVIVYAGAIMVLFLFVIMLLGRPSGRGEWSSSLGVLAASALGSIGLAVGIVVVASRAHFAPAVAPAEDFGTTTAVARELFTTYLFPFELTSVMLLIAVVGSVLLARAHSLRGRADQE